MDWTEFLDNFAERPLFHTSMLNIFDDPLHHRQVQLARWTKVKKLSQIRRGWYLIEKPWRLTDIPIPFIANNVVHPSYLSLDWALQYAGMIPEYVPNPTSITTERATRFSAQGTLFIYHHVRPSFFKGYRKVTVEGYELNIAYPEKALLDKIYLFLRKNRLAIQWLKGLRIQNTEDFDLERFKAYWEEHEQWRKKSGKAMDAVLEYIKEMKGEGL